MTRRSLAALALSAMLVAGCASLPQRDPPQITVAGLEPLPGQGLELRLLLKLRVQNPNDAPIDYDGVFVKLDVQGRTFATGVSDARGSVPRYGEAVVAVPITASAWRMARQVFGAMNELERGQSGGKVGYDLSGKFSSAAGLGSLRFSSRGELELPGMGRDDPAT
ncbi:MAG: LEA type 2 family protein [Sinobacteraceae bacterium]|nr:LEA type 2 family protein [Nevskiaceae bacterium]MCP5360243.1 LEA type 2 family protein [Nevskiaceae bacterium]MCP5466620.1 LEA type 2 family protein [Nevskiaceae bacterium]